MTDETIAGRDDQHCCFRCGRDLGPRLEWKKMDTEAGPICYLCFNDASAAERAREQPQRDR